METYTQHITRTRIAIPRKRADLISRQRLLDALDELLDKKIIIIAAPAGYGKTSLLIDLADDLALPVCWYSLDALDQNISRFLEYFVAAVQVRFPTFKTNAINILHSSFQKEVDIDAMVTMLVNDIYDQITEHFIIMLDDYHLVVEDVQINQFLSRFVQNVEENCHIVFASRTLLSLPDLPLLVARGMVGGMGFEELAFNTNETRELFFNNHKIVLSETEAEDLCKQTEGWITGLLLTAQTSISRLQAHEKSLRATGVNINDYFELIYNAQPEHIQQFLLYTSLLEDFDFNTVNQTIAKLFPELGKQYKACADHIFKDNLFVQSVGLDGQSLRYHHLFLDYLQQKVRLEQADTYNQLQNIIAAYFQQTQQWEKAYQIYKKEGQLDKQIALLEEAGASMMLAGQLSILQLWLKDMPEEIILTKPVLSSLMGTVLSNSDNLQNSLAYLSNAFDKIDSKKQPGLMARTSIRMAVAHKSIGHYQDALRIANETLDIINDDLSFREIRAESYRIIGTCYTEMGNPIDSLKFLELAFDDYSYLQKENEIAITSFNLGTAYYMLSEYPIAKKFFLQNIGFWEKTGNHVWLATVLNNMGVLQHSCGEIEDAVMNLEKSLHYSQLTNNKRLEAIVLNGIGDIYTDLGAYEEANSLYQQSVDISKKINSKYMIIYAFNAISLVSIYQYQHIASQKYLDDAKKISSELKSEY
ncbi:MAG: tetratricopeptide repeat protein, partial [Anaerolineaceae bacterium]|nr:tetratricopeptide repeat protein [Anaerolineaceae bacterium]